MDSGDNPFRPGDKLKFVHDPHFVWEIGSIVTVKCRLSNRIVALVEDKREDGEWSIEWFELHKPAPYSMGGADEYEDILAAQEIAKGM